MENKKYLSFTHGTVLQNLCEDILATPQYGGDYIRWIWSEKESLRKKQPTVWSIPVSTELYYVYLGKLETALARENCRETIQTLLEEIRQLTRKKIHALFLTQETFCWPSLESVYKAAVESPDYEASVVYTPYFHKNFSEQSDYLADYQEMGIPVLRHNEYDLPQDSPDVAFMIKPYGSVPEQYVMNHLECVVPRVVYIPYGMEITTDLIRFGFQYYGHYRAWRHCAYGEIVKAYGTKFGYRNGENLAVWGHPKADHYRNMEQNRENIPEEWKQRIGNRKTILWTPHHLIDLNETGTGTWLIWGDHILKQALEHPELFFIVRPHPLMMGALVNTGSITEDQAEEIRNKIDSAENMIWDTYDDYRLAFDAADAIITDGTTFSVEFLYTKKPILLTPRNMEGFYIYEEMLRSYYIVNSIQDIADFMDMMQAGEDPLKEKRLALHDKTFMIPESGTVGENIIRNVKIDLEKECKEMEFKTEDIREELEQVSDEQQDVQFPLVTVLLLCYKNQELLYGMLDTIFKQDYPRIQLVITDDASEGFDIDKIRAYVDLNKRRNIEDVVVRTNEINMRTVPHIHAAMEFVKGEYLVFTAADDRFVGNDVISTYVTQFLENPEKHWLVAKCRVTTPDYKKTLHYLPAPADESFFAADDAKMLFSRWARRGLAIPCCMAFRTKAIEMVGGFDLDYLFIEDWPLELKLLRGGNAPIFCDKVTALHSTGGITNSNDRYGKEIRRLFYEDKYTVFRKEVDPYLDMMTPEDRKAYKLYLKEIMARHYYFYIDLPGTSKLERLKLIAKKPIRLWWMMENKFVTIKDKIPKKKMLVASQALLLLSMIFLNVSEQPAWQLFRLLGWAYLAGGLLLILALGLIIPYSRYCKKKAKLRHSLVN